MVSMANSIEVKKYSQGLAIETNNFAFEVKDILGPESTCQDGQEAKIGLNGPQVKQG